MTRSTLNRAQRRIRAALRKKGFSVRLCKKAIRSAVRALELEAKDGRKFCEVTKGILRSGREAAKVSRCETAARDLRYIVDAL